MNITIDEEFKSLIPPLSDLERVQLEDNLHCLGNTSFSSDELAKIDAILMKASPPRI